MERRDYIQKQVDQFAQVLANILARMIGLEQQGNLQSVLREGSQALQEEVHLDIDYLLGLSESEAIRILREEGWQKHHLETLADSMSLMAESAAEIKDKEKKMALYRLLHAIDTDIYENPTQAGMARYARRQRMKKEG